MAICVIKMYFLLGADRDEHLTKQGVHYARTNAYIIIMPALCSQSIRAANYAGILNAYIPSTHTSFVFVFERYCRV